ncbi:CHASE2 domain-containing protein, partial [bacterium]|nr:CHASE2 domain-containing protein [bacterium]
LNYYFQGRSALGFETKIDPRLKVYVFDDLTVSSLKENDLSAKRWAEVFKAISEENPKAIITTHPFSVPKSLHNPLNFTDDIQAIKTKIATGVWLTSKNIAGLLPLAPEDYPSLSLKSHYNVSNPGEINWYMAEDKQVFGPNPGVMNAFGYFGGTWGYSHEIPLVTRLDDEHVLPHIALHAADSLSTDLGQLVVNDIKVPMSKEGLIQVNFVDPNIFFEKMKSILDPVRRVMRSIPFDAELSNGDVVLILPNFSTGLVKYVDTPLGVLPEGYVVASVLNSVLSGNWIFPQQFEWAYLLLLCFLGVLIGRLLKKSRTPFYVLLAIAVTLFSSLFLFAAVGMAFPVMLGSFALIFTSATCLFIRRHRQSLRFEEVLRVSRYLWGRNGTKSIERRYRKIPDEPSKQIVSLVHLRLEGVSKILKNLVGEPLYDEFRRYELEATKIIHEMGGVEVKSRDGRKLAYFSSDLSKEGSQNHAEKAVVCAERLIRFFATMLEEKMNEGDFVTEIKASIESAPIHIGNFGDLDHLVPVVLGQQVENLFGLSSACPPMKIYIGKSTFNLLDSDDYKSLKEKKVDIEGEKISFYEFNPVPEQKEFLKDLESRL